MDAQEQQFVLVPVNAGQSPETSFVPTSGVPQFNSGQNQNQRTGQLHG